VAEWSRGGLTDAAAAEVIQCETELLQLDAICDEAMRMPPHHPHGAHAAAAVALDDGYREEEEDDDCGIIAAGGGGGGGGAPISGAGSVGKGASAAGGSSLSVPSALPPAAALALDEAAGTLAERLRGVQSLVVPRQSTSTLAQMQRLLCAAIMLSLPYTSPEVGVGLDALIRQLRPSVRSACEMLCRLSEPRALGLLPALIRTLGDAQTTHQAAAFPSSASAPAAVSAASAAAGRAAAEALALIEKLLQAAAAEEAPAEVAARALPAAAASGRSAWKSAAQWSRRSAFVASASRLFTSPAGLMMASSTAIKTVQPCCSFRAAWRCAGGGNAKSEGSGKRLSVTWRSSRAMATTGRDPASGCRRWAEARGAAGAAHWALP